MEWRQTAGDGDPPRRKRDQYLPVGPGTCGLFGHLSARAGRVPPTAAQRITGETQEEREEGKSALEDFLAFAREKVKGYKRRGQIGTFRSYRTTCRKFTASIEETYGREEVPFGVLEAELFREFRTCCYEERGNSTSAAQRELSVLHTLVRHAMKKEKLSAYPFEHIVTHSEPSQKELLTPKEVERIADLKIDEDSSAAEARRWFLFAYYAGEMRFSDVATLQWQHIREGRSGRPRIFYKMKKTADTVGVPLIPEAKQILSRYDEGSGEEWVLPISEAIDPGDEVEEVFAERGLEHGTDVAVVSNPEFLREGSVEMIKYASNSLLATRISFMNEIANVCERVGANADKVRLEISKDHRIGPHFLYAGIGFGGSCFPKDVKALARKGAEVGYGLKVLEATLDVNDRQRRRLALDVRERFDGDLSGKKIAVWGLSFKPGTDDTREAPSHVIINELLEDGAEVAGYDPEAIGTTRETFGD